MNAHRQAISVIESLDSYVKNHSVRFFDEIDLLNVLLTSFYLEFVSPPPSATQYHRLRTWVWKSLRKIKQWNQLRGAKSCSGNFEETPLIFWPADITHVSAQVPILAHLPRDLPYFFFAGTARALKQLQCRGLDKVLSYTEWPDLILQAQLEGKHRAKMFSGLKFENNTDLALERRVKRAFASQVDSAILAVLQANRLIECFKPDVLVIGNDLTVEGRAASLVAKQKGVTTIVPSHGSVLSESTHGYHVADIMTVYGPNQKQTMVDLGVSPDRIVATGATHLDPVPQQSNSVHPVLKERLNLRDSTPWVLVATSGAGHIISWEQHRQTILNLFSACARLREIHFVVKLHRKDRPRYYSEMPKSIQDRFTVIPFGEPGWPVSIFDWLQGCKAVLTGGSTVAIESMVVNVPVISMDFTDELRNVPFIADHATIHTTSLNELCAALEKTVLKQELPPGYRDRASRYLSGEISPLDGFAGIRLANLIVEQIYAKHAISDVSNF